MAVLTVMDELSLFAQWETTLRDLLARTEKFPKRHRFTFTTRIDNLALDVLDELVKARYSNEKSAHLNAVNLLLESLRVLLRICHAEGFLVHRGFEHMIRRIDEAGRMTGGWIRQQEGR